MSLFKGFKNKGVEKHGRELVEGEKLYTVATGSVNPFEKGSRMACTLLMECEGYVGTHIIPNDGRLLWFYDSLNNAKIARNKLESMGGKAGTNIMQFVVKGGEPQEGRLADG